jgi:hypothetical protein
MDLTSSDRSPTPINEASFEDYAERLILAPEELAVARRCAQRIDEALRSVSGAGPADGPRHLVVGSIGKRTAIRPAPTLDMLYLARGTALDGRSDWSAVPLGDIEEKLKTEPGAVAVIADRARLLIGLNVVKVAVNLAREEGDGYMVARDDGWTTSNPVAEMAALRLSDAVTGGRSTQLLALLKAWRIANAVPIASFALEILAREFMADRGAAGWHDMLTDFFAWSRQRTPARLDLPGGSAMLEIDDLWHGQAESAYWRSVLARHHANAEDWGAAREEWRRILGQHFGAPTGFSIWAVRPDR